MEQSQENLENMRRQLNTSNTRLRFDGSGAATPDRTRRWKAAHVKGTAHEFNSEEARNAGRKGGETVSRDREHMAEIGRRGGRSSGNNRKPDGETRNSL
jgi:general stress protein YciG